MAIHLSDILDLEYLLHQDEQAEADGPVTDPARRDREIFRLAGHPDMTESELLMAWLSRRRDARHPDESDLLPGRIWTRCYGGMVLVSALLGLSAGFVLSLGFLVYHGIHPVNVALFFTVFVLLPVLMTFFSAAGLVAGARRSTRSGPGWLHVLMRRGITTHLPALADRIFRGRTAQAMAFVDTVIRERRREYGPLFFWPVAGVTGIAAAWFSGGVMAGLLFRVTFTDVAFGWQSTLAATPHSVYELVQIISLPWSSWMPAGWAGPTPEQIAGSRIVLKQGIAALSSGDLASWWPFLCQSLIWYAILPRIFLVLFARYAHHRSVAGFDFCALRFRALLMRMTTPRVEIRYVEAPEAPNREQTLPMPDPRTPVAPDPDDARTHRSGRALVLAPASVWEGEAARRMLSHIRTRYGLVAETILPVSQDADTDGRDLAAAVTDTALPVIFLQEVWQPPIRGLLYYFRQMKQGLLADRDVMILLTRSPDDPDSPVALQDVDFQVWQAAIREMGMPGLRGERMRS